MTQPSTDDSLTRLVDEQLDLAASKLPALEPLLVHPSPVDHDERRAAHATLEDVLLGHTQATSEMLQELAAQEAALPLSEEELARQALAYWGCRQRPFDAGVTRSGGTWVEQARDFVRAALSGQRWR